MASKTIIECWACKFVSVFVRKPHLAVCARCHALIASPEIRAALAKTDTTEQEG